MRWVTIDEYPHYSVNENGIVKRNSYIRTDKIGRKTIVKEKILKQYIDKKGYLRVSLCKDGKNHFLTLHRIIAKAFIPNEKNLPCINHKNEIKTDNRIENLEWCSVSYNNNYGDRQKRVSETQGKKIIGIRGDEILFFNSGREAGRFVKGSSGNITECANGKYKKAYGYEWRWA